MECYLKEVFNERNVKKLQCSGGGCISEGCGYQVGPRKLFVKTNERTGADVMFSGEYESLLALQNTNCVKVPQPIKVCRNADVGGEILIMEYLEITSLSSYQAKLGKDLAKLHLHNVNLLEKKRNDKNTVKKESDCDPVEKFGFHSPTCCGFIPLDNSWCQDWVEFYMRHRLKNKIDVILQDSGDRELMELWSSLQLKVGNLFKGVSVYPSLLHGDLWAGNAAQMSDGPVIFDPASFYGHHEFELSITNIFGGFNSSFFNSYHEIIPKSPGFEGRHQIYKLFHYLNHWNHFGAGYRGSSLSTMRNALKACNDETDSMFS